MLPSDSQSGTPPFDLSRFTPEDPLVVLVDDDAGVLSALGKALGVAGYRVETFDDPRAAVAALESLGPHLLITDKEMPGLDGIQLARRALELDPDLAVMVLTGAGDVRSAAESLRLGVVDYLTKPIQPRELERHVQRALWRRGQALFDREMRLWLRAEVEDRTRELERRNADLRRLNVGILGALTHILEAKSAYFKGHSEAVSSLSGAIAAALGLPAEEVERVRTAGLLHDLGMIGVSDQIINKAEHLTADEYAQVQRHCALGSDILRPLGHLGEVRDYVLGHHERLDGSGYPRGLRGDAIPLGAQIVGVAEAWAGLTEDRPYRTPYQAEDALETLRGAEGLWFSGRILDGLTRALSTRPTS